MLLENKEYNDTYKIVQEMLGKNIEESSISNEAEKSSYKTDNLLEKDTNKFLLKVGDVEIKTVSIFGVLGLIGVTIYSLYEIANYHDHSD